MMDFLNRQRTYLNTKVPHVPNNKEHALEEANTVVVKHDRAPLFKRIRKMFKGQSKAKNDE